MSARRRRRSSRTTAVRALAASLLGRTAWAGAAGAAEAAGTVSSMPHVAARAASARMRAFWAILHRSRGWYAGFRPRQQLCFCLLAARVAICMCGDSALAGAPPGALAQFLAKRPPLGSSCKDLGTDA